MANVLETSLYWYRATVACVVDGDTVDADVNLGFGVTVRQRGGVRGALYLATLYTEEGIDMNQLMLRLGLAKVYER